MFKSNIEKDISQHYPTTNLINVRANKNSLQFCIFKINKMGGYTILNEGNIPIGEVVSFKIKERKNEWK